MWLSSRCGGSLNNAFGARYSSCAKTLVRGLFVGALCLPNAVVAQAYETGGIQLRFAIDAEVETQSNAALNPKPPASTTTIKTGLTADLLSQTRTQELAFSVGIAQRHRTGDGPSAGARDFVDPHVAFRYQRATRDALLAFTGIYEETQLSSATPSAGFEEAVLPVSGSATRRSSRLGLNLEWGLATPLSYGLKIEQEYTSFREGSATGLGGAPLNDTRTVQIAGSAKLDLDATTRLFQSIGFHTFDQDTAVKARRTFESETTLRVERPLGELVFSSGFLMTEEGFRLHNAVRTTADLPSGKISAGVGLSRAATGRKYLTGIFTYGQKTATGGLNVHALRAVSSSTQTDREQIVTILGVRYATDVGPGQITFRGDHAHSRNTQTFESVADMTVEIGYAAPLARNVVFDLGLRHRRRQDSVTGRARSNEFFISLGRVFVTRY